MDKCFIQPANGTDSPIYSPPAPYFIRSFKGRDNSGVEADQERSSSGAAQVIPVQKASV